MDEMQSAASLVKTSAATAAGAGTPYAAAPASSTSRGAAAPVASSLGQGGKQLPGAGGPADSWADEPQQRASQNANANLVSSSSSALPTPSRMSDGLLFRSQPQAQAQAPSTGIRSHLQSVGSGSGGGIANLSGRAGSRSAAEEFPRFAAFAAASTANPENISGLSQGRSRPVSPSASVNAHPVPSGRRLAF